MGSLFRSTYRLNDVKIKKRNGNLEHFDRSKVVEAIWKAAKEVGINYVYIGNLPTENGENTYCPKCKELLIERSGFTIIKNNLKNGKCSCGEKIPSVWKI